MPLRVAGRVSLGAGAQAGFTMIELLVVIAVVGILSVPGTIYFLRFAELQALNGAAQQMSVHLHQARQLAITNTTSYKIDFDTANGRLRFLRPAACDPSAGSGPTACTPWTGAGTDSQGWRLLENNARIVCAPAAGSGCPITFNFLGTGTGGTIEMRAAKGQGSRYVIVGSTGRIRQASAATCSASCP
jgi:prepilin-type N-terminal cleavage/methylation domain-containing protein